MNNLEWHTIDYGKIWLEEMGFCDADDSVK